jgi:hypothetical protein
MDVFITRRGLNFATGNASFDLVDRSDHVFAFTRIQNFCALQLPTMGTG